MSSLLQFSGEIKNGKVGLQFYLCPSETVLELGIARKRMIYGAPMLEPVPCTKCGKNHEQLYIAFRKPAGMWGHWVVFRYNGEEHVPDLSIPIAVDRIPRGARKLSPEENAEVWHSD